MQTKYNIGDKVYIEAEIVDIMSPENNKIIYGIKSDSMHRIHGYPVGPLFVEEDSLTPVPEIVITGIEVSEDSFTLVGENLDPEGKYEWFMDFDENKYADESTGVTLELTEEIKAAYEAAEKATAIIKVKDYTSDTIKIKGFDVSITSIEATENEGIVSFKAIGENLDETAEYEWIITYDATEASPITSTGPELVLSEGESTVYINARNVSAIVKTGDYSSERIEIKAPAVPSVTSISVSEEEGHTVLTAVGENLEETEEYVWCMRFDEDEVNATSTGTSLVLTEEQTTAFAAANTVVGEVSIGGYTSPTLVIKEVVISIDSITESLDGENNVVLTLVGQNLKETDTYEWTLHFDTTPLIVTETGISITLDATQTADYNAATSVTAVVRTGDYISDLIAVKQ